MDENGRELLPEQEISSPSAQTEFGDPSPQTELPSVPRLTEEYYVERRESVEEGEEKKKGTTRRLIRYVAATAAAVGLLAEAAPAPAPAPSPTPPIEYVETESCIVIECAAVLPDEPEILYFSEYSTDPRVGATGWSRRYCIVEPDGTEQEIPGYYILSLADEYTRYCFMRQDESSVEGENCVYKLFSADEDISAYRNDPEWASFGTIGFRTNHLQVEELREGSLFKIVETYRMGEVWYRMTTVRKIDFLPPEPEIRVSLKTEPLGDGYSQAQFRAVVRPREGDGHDYYFGDPWQIYEEHPEAVTAQQSDGGGLLLDGISSFQSFCVRWYDADHNFLQEGWEYVMPYSVQRWPFPSCSHEGRDFIIEYDGLVQSSSPNEDAAFYSLELNLMDLSTGWHYLIETEQVPITD